jgi:BASS family bile acid:Na+ symporter
MMMSVVKVVLIPVLLGILIYRIFPKQIDALRDLLPLISVIAIVMIISGIVASNAQKIVSCGALVMLVVAIHNGIGLCLGTGVAKLLKLEERKANFRKS